MDSGPDARTPNQFRVLASGFSVQFASRLGVMLSGFLTVVVLTRYLSPESYGIYVAVTSYPLMFGAFTDLGANSTIVKEATGELRAIVALSSLNLAWSIVVAVPLMAFAVLGGLLGFSSTSETAVLLAIVAPYLGCSVVTTCYFPVFQAASRFSGAAVAELANSFTVLVGTFLVVAADAGLRWVAAVFSFGALCRLLVTIATAERLAGLRPNWNLGAAFRLMIRSVPIGLSVVIGGIYYRVDAIALSALSTVEQVGLYGLGYRLLMIVIAVPNIIGLTMFRSLAATPSSNELKRTVPRLMSVFFFVGSGMALGGFLVGDRLVIAVGGVEYAAAGRTVELLMLSSIFTSLNTGLSYVLIVMHLERRLVALSGVMLLGHVALNVVLCSRYGATGAAVSLLVTGAVSTAFATWLARRVLSTPSSRIIASATLVLGFEAVVVVATSQLGLVAQVGFGATAFVLAICLTDPFELSIKSRIGSIVKNFGRSS